MTKMTTISQNPRRSRTCVLSLVALSSCLTTLCGAVAPAFADDKKAQAIELFDAARALTAQGRHPEACPKYEDSQKLDPAIGTLFYWAECLEKTGRLASAFASYTEVAEQAGEAKMPDKEKYAGERAAALKIRLTRLLILVPEDVKSAPGLEIKRDGTVVGPSLWGTALPVDSGKHEISVSANGKRQWSSIVEAAGEGSTVTVTIPSLKEEPAVGPVVSATGGAMPVVVMPVNAGWGGQKIAGSIAAGAGAVGLLVGGILGGLAIGKNGEANGFCRPDAPTLCTAQGVALGQDVKTLGTVSTVALIAGGVIAAGGVALFLTAPSGDASPKAGSGIRVRLSAGRIDVEGSW